MKNCLKSISFEFGSLVTLIFLQLALYFVLFFSQLCVSLHLFLHFHQPFQDFQKVYIFPRSKLSQFQLQSTVRSVEISVTILQSSSKGKFRRKYPCFFTCTLLSCSIIHIHNEKRLLHEAFWCTKKKSLVPFPLLAI